MASPYLSEIKLVSFNFAPKGWLFCDGQLLPISDNTALFALLGTNFGGNGTNNFQLPNLQGASPMHAGGQFVLGRRGGETTHTLIAAEMPTHSHQAVGVAKPAITDAASGASWAISGSNPYAAGANVTMASAAVQSQGGGQPHDNMHPYLVMNFVIALQGIFPSQS
jgi:microcystin-dependent protein